MSKYYCEDCVACDKKNIDEPICQFDDVVLEFDITTKTPCSKFIPCEYIRALNYDSITR